VVVPLPRRRVVVFSKTLNANMEVAAIEGSFASVIGGAPAAAVVFAREVDGRTKKDPRVRELEAAVKSATTDGDRASLRTALADVIKTVRSEKLGEVPRVRPHSQRAPRPRGRVADPSSARRSCGRIDAIERGGTRNGALAHHSHRGNPGPGLARGCGARIAAGLADQAKWPTPASRR
jgi:hypothetical protein